MQQILKHLILIIIALMIVILIQAILVTGFVVKDNRMSPNLNKGDRIIVNKIKSTFNLLDNNDIIMYRNGSHIEIGRIIGKSGQSIAYKNATLYRDDRKINESYIKGQQIESLSLRHIKQSEGDIVPPNMYFVLNDQRADKHDSRTYGLVQSKDIIGDVSLRFYPMKKFTVDFN
ncbi:signal peptidase I [Staphylococcus gallinarum]|uniref:Signal peptidase I n=1 Tax=Staphylococcus gallinarum TaxID=1293 RepID=A0A3A0VP92_STAGA|nr:signal peptidase I [Staphylococcus gallinarum]RIP35778.1 signal peptidase I [Staphylococcus gallinarum]